MKSETTQAASRCTEQRVVRPFPDAVGVWHCDGAGTTDGPYDCEIYEIPTGALCAWCDDCGRILDETEVWVDDEWFGHIPAHLLDQDGMWSLVSNDVLTVSGGREKTNGQ